MELIPLEIDHVLPLVEKPARYINHELNSINKVKDDSDINFCFAFPDVYEVGVSHLGIKILYSILNKTDGCAADRVYCPWPDMGNLLTEENIPLFGIESRVAVKDFDVVGFTLQSELTFTNILYMLDLADIPINRDDRNDNYPLVIAGGPSASNPLPVSMFFDAILIGEGEEAIVEIYEIVKKTKGLSKEEKLRELSSIAGLFVPSIHKDDSIKIRKYNHFHKSENMHDNQLVPWIQPVHNRYTAEIMRGCSRGCRFCHAGYFYRPVRERNPEDIIKPLLEEVGKYGWEEAALVSLSSSDYTCIKDVLITLSGSLKNDRAKLSLPSLRVDSLDDDLINLLNRMGSKGLTIAPEAGSQRLRDIINKQLTEKDILEGVKIALANGWQLIKLYFMIGLPFETDEDVLGIVDIVEKIIAISGKKLRINITVSPFVPKPFTPFQWAPMDSRENLIRKVYIIKNALKRYRFIKMKYHQIESSMLEGVITRGDESISEWIYSAYKNGAKFDGWDEHFDFANWEKSDIDYLGYLNGRDFDTDLVWDRFDIGVKKEFLAEEWTKSEQAATTPDCRENCTLCGLCDSVTKPVYSRDTKLEIPTPPLPVEQDETFYYRFYYGKTDYLQYVAHLDVLRMFHRLLRVADIPLAYTQGFNKHPKISLSAPLSIGVEGETEFVDVALCYKMDTDKIKEAISAVLPAGITISHVEPAFDKKMRSMEYFNYEYVEVYFPKELEEHFSQKLAHYNHLDELIYSRIRKKKEKSYNLKMLVESMEVSDNTLFVKKTLQSVSIFDILEHVFGFTREKASAFKIVRKRLEH